MQEKRIGWRQFREFAHVDLEASFLLSWSQEGETLLLDVDVALLPDHPFYEVPRPSQRACIRAALIEFPFCEGMAAGRVPELRKPGEVIGELAAGPISDLRLAAEGRYELQGEFGNVLIDAERPLLRLKQH